jgi:peptide/nickel transport system ATP-binding protein/oligopeptide transport system ATP-binding protein
MLDAVGIPDPERRYRAWPHELSGGMAQRVLIAMALVADPDLLIADEPTTGLDVTVQAQVLDLLRSLVLSRGLAAVIITHDFGVVANYCDRVAVMFAGRVVESGTVRGVFTTPTHPYTQALFAAMPERLQLGAQPLVGAPPPDLYDLPSGCHYRLRCPLAGADCAADPPQRALGADHLVACHRVAESVA